MTKAINVAESKPARDVCFGINKPVSCSVQLHPYDQIKLPCVTRNLDCFRKIFGTSRSYYLPLVLPLVGCFFGMPNHELLRRSDAKSSLSLLQRKAATDLIILLCFLFSRQAAPGPNEAEL